MAFDTHNVQAVLGCSLWKQDWMRSVALRLRGENAERQTHNCALDFKRAIVRPQADINNLAAVVVLSTVEQVL